MCSYHRLDTKQLPYKFTSLPSSKLCTCNMHKIWIDTVHSNFDCVHFVYAEYLSVYVAKTTLYWQNKDWILYNTIQVCLHFKLEIFITASCPYSAILCKNQSYKNRTFCTHLLTESSSIMVGNICFNIHMDYCV
jgi:hypothetical protein